MNKEEYVLREFDLDHVYTHFGYALGVKLASSQGYKDLLNAFWDMHVLGPSRKDLQIFLAAMSGTAMGRPDSMTRPVIPSPSL